MSRLPDSMIGGGVVRRRFQFGEEHMVPGGRDLTAEEVRAMPRNNRNALVDKGFFSLIPKAEIVEIEPSGLPFSVLREDGKYDVVLGTIVNERPLTKKQADTLVAQHQQSEATEN